MYQARRPSRSELVPVRHLRYHVRLWGDVTTPASTPLVLLHGWMDVAASWQFVVDALEKDHSIIAPDWRGFGLTQGPPVDSYWFPDYLADLDFLLDHYAPDTPVHLVGHSMGGAVAMLYAGARPRRIARLVNLEGFGRPATEPSQAPRQQARWMDELKALHRGEKNLQAYDSLEAVARRLMKTNPRLSQDKALWLARHWAQAGQDGRWRILGDPAHKVISAHLYRVEEALASYRRITAPVLWAQAKDSSLAHLWEGRMTQAEFHERLKAVPKLQTAQIEGAGHMLHHDQPAAVAQLIENFLANSA